MIGCVSVSVLAVYDHERLGKLSIDFPGIHRQVEQQAVRAMARICDDYDGDHWSYVALNAGVGFLALPADKAFHIEIPGNGFSGTVDGRTAGLIATLFGLLDLYLILKGNPVHTASAVVLLERLDRLKDYARTLATAEGIFRAVG